MGRSENEIGCLCDAEMKKKQEKTEFDEAVEFLMKKW
jgi:hypothetical protein